MQIKLFDLLFNKDEITWQSIIQDLIKEGKVDPWDVDVSLLTKEYMKKLKSLKETDFKVSGKVVLAAALLLKIKSDRLLGADLEYFDRLISNEEELFEDSEFDVEESTIKPEKPTLMPRTPQPRERKVTIYDLMEALEKAIETRNRRVIRNLNKTHAPVVERPKKKKDISIIIKEIYTNILQKIRKQPKITFNDLVPTQEKKDKVYTFIPLLHLAKQERVDLNQKQHFGTIHINVLKPNETIEEYEKEMKELELVELQEKSEEEMKKILKERENKEKQNKKTKNKKTKKHTKKNKQKNKNKINNKKQHKNGKNK